MDFEESTFGGIRLVYDAGHSWYIAAIGSDGFVPVEAVTDGSIIGRGIVVRTMIAALVQIHTDPEFPGRS